MWGIVLNSTYFIHIAHLRKHTLVISHENKRLMLLGALELVVKVILRVRYCEEPGS